MTAAVAGVAAPKPMPSNTRASDATNLDSSMARQIPAGHTRSLARSAVPGVIVGLLLGGGSAAQGASPEVAGGLAALGILATTVEVTAINYTNHNGTFHDGKQWNTPLESMGIGAAVGAASGVLGAMIVGKPAAAVALGVSGIVGGALSGAIMHFFNRPNGGLVGEQH
jgi:hypothetical protein